MSINTAIENLKELELACRAGIALLESGVIRDDDWLQGSRQTPTYDFAVGGFLVKRAIQTEKEYNAGNN